MNLARWIRRNPVPHAIVCDDQRITIGDGHRRWADAVDAIMATSSSSISAVAKDGSVLRVLQRADVDDLPAQDDGGAEITDRQRELAQIAQIVSDAYSTAHEHARENSARGYELLARFAELSFGRLAAIERAYAQLLAAHARAMEETQKDEGIDGALSGLLSTAMNASSSSSASSASSPGGNGKGEAKP